MKYPEGAGEPLRVSEPRAIYVPIFDSFFESSIMREDVVTRFVFLALIRLASRPRAQGVVDIDPLMFAQSINIPYDEVVKALGRLMEPDEHSGSKLERGRRLIPLDPANPLRGWRLVNWVGYSKLLNKAHDKYRKQKEREEAERLRLLGQSGQNANVTHDTIRNNTNTKLDEEKRERARFAPPTIEDVFEYSREIPGLNAEAFFDFYASKGWRVGNSPMRDWKAAARKWRRKDIEDGRVMPAAVPKSMRSEEALKEAELQRRAAAESERVQKAWSEYHRLLDTDPEAAKVFKEKFEREEGLR